MAKGNPNPSPATRFKKGNKFGGKTSKQKKLEYEAAEMAAALRHRILSGITEKLKSGEIGDVCDILDANTLKLFKDSEDRAHGTPKQTSEIGGLDGGDLAMSLTLTTKIVDAD